MSEEVKGKWTKEEQEAYDETYSIFDMGYQKFRDFAREDSWVEVENVTEEIINAVHLDVLSGWLEVLVRVRQRMGQETQPSIEQVNDLAKEALIKDQYDRYVDVELEVGR